MRLKKIRLVGFKSFVDPTTIPFPGDMTAVVGPNGCGKSNVIDAVRWVLGESSAKNLRGDAMTDVIFNGSSARKAVSQCSVELVFDNSSGRIQGEFAAYNEISVKRVVTKEALSSYFLNSAKCRRRDITDLFLGTGLGPRSYAIIEQGMISRLIESKPQELRVFIEEAAGISKYKERRKETHTRIKHTKENLERLEDVRQELGEQIAKLKRQANAATRYKELKQQERQLKAELATIKWLTQSQIMADAQAIIANKQQALDNLAANQQGDESGLQALKNQQSMCKQSIDDLQHQVFTLGTQITKLEQSALFAEKRSNQIQSEIEQIEQSESSLKSSIAAVSKEITQTQEKLLLLEPEKELLQEQLYELEDKKHDADADLEAHVKIAKQKEEAYYSKTQLLQQKHSQIQQTLSLQARTETRLNELEDELASLQEQSTNIDLEALSTQRIELTSNIAKHQQLQQKLTRDLDDANTNYHEARKINDDERNTLTLKEARLETLELLQAETNKKNNAISKEQQQQINNFLGQFRRLPIWEYFEIEKGAERMLNSALYEMQSAWVIDAPSISTSLLEWPQDLWQHCTDSLFFRQQFTRNKEPGSLAALLTNDDVPHIFNTYYIAKDYTQALSLLPTLTKTAKVLTPDGSIFTQDTFITHQQAENKILRAAQIKTLVTDRDSQAIKHQQSKESVDKTEKVRNDAKQALDLMLLNVQKLRQEQQSQEISYQNLLFQQQQSSQRTQKISVEINQHSERLSIEEMSLEILNEEVEEVHSEVLQLEDDKTKALAQTEKLRVRQQQWQAQHSQMQSTLHEQSMLIQQIRNSLQILEEQKNNKKQLVDNNISKLELLNVEAEELSMPHEQQHKKLQEMLLQQTSLRDLQAKRQNDLADIELQIKELEKGQHGIVSKMNAIKSEIESQRIRSESANVRAQSFIEQLSELKQSVKEIIDILPADTDEKTWQDELEVVSTSIDRLGAVNLAAVDEYEEQSKRKEHLDAQNLDLTQALDTLENAMRKIDKETRSRFKQTFEQVDADLKSLFPKVFGGGMAYLALTDDDLLETGVTIMARPPGKKNSTIHLLSGGEKALTALSLVFAIFRLNPAPFCLLDEVDAPLDDANVVRFCRLVSQMSASVQFIYITHNKVAMEMATHLTGVTMAEPGVSRMVAVDMEQALAITQ